MVKLLVFVLMVFLVPNVSLADGTVDGILVLDTSGSMKKNDPDNFRIDGQETFIDVLTIDDDNRFGIVHFDTRARLVQHLAVLHKDNLNYFKRKLQKPTNKGSWTEIGRGLDRALTEFHKDKRSSSKQYVILMTDGDVDRSPSSRDDETAYRELMAIVLNYKRQGISIFTMAMTKNSRSALTGKRIWQSGKDIKWTSGERSLQEIAVETGGDFKRILSKQDIVEFIQLVYTRIRQPAAVETTSETGEFVTSKYDKAIVGIIPPSSVIVSPSGEIYARDSNPDSLSSEFDCFPYRLWQVNLIYRPTDEELWDTDKWKGKWKVQKPDGTPIPDQEILIKSDLKLLWGRIMHDEYSQNEVVALNVKLEYKGEKSEEILEDVVNGTICACYVREPESKEPVYNELDGPFFERGDNFFKGEFDGTIRQGIYSIKVECRNDDLKLKRNIKRKFRVTEPYFSFKGLNISRGGIIFDSSGGEKVDTPDQGQKVRLIAGMTEYFPELSTPLEIKGEIFNPSKKKQNIMFVKDKNESSYNSEIFDLKKNGTYIFVIEANGKRSVKLDHAGWYRESVEMLKDVPFIVRYKKEVEAAGTLFYKILGWIIAIFAILLIVAVCYSFYLHSLPGINVNLEILQPQPGVIAMNLFAKPWWNRAINRLFPSKERTIGSGPNADYRLPDSPVEIDTSGISAKLKVDRKGNIYINSMTEPSHIKIGRIAVDREGMLIREVMEVLDNFKIQIGKYLIRFS